MVVVDGGDIVVLVSVVDNLEGLNMFLEALDLGHDCGGVNLLVFVEVLEDKARTVADVLLDVLDLLDQEELVLLGQIVQVEFVGEIDDASLGRRLVIFFFVEVVYLVCELLLELLKDVEGLQVPLIRLSFQFSQSVVQEHLYRVHPQARARRIPTTHRGNSLKFFHWAYRPSSNGLLRVGSLIGFDEG